MNKILITILLLLGMVSFSYAQSENWNNWNWLLGKWEGKGSGKPGEGDGIFSFEYQLENKIIVRKSHSEYPATEKKPKIVHEDLMVIYLDKNKTPTKAIYFDNEGQSINYNITYSDKIITFLSEKVTNAPIFRLTYSLLENNEINTKFELSQDGKNFINYIEGKSRKIN